MYRYNKSVDFKHAIIAMHIATPSVAHFLQICNCIFHLLPNIRYRTLLIDLISPFQLSEQKFLLKENEVESPES